ncbi:MAG: Asp-tRNA(Asn)/Glu-tRNA(Gln) amidotransferase subunit GatC [Rhizobiales bacterium]|nr:Asp-tRNA(Asn)/Glu-tRNA(Gln) amidotransferase subunit GatC [Hyphomicrobiales bacterium]NRB14865.1 Asp-tRNA(Asn)/Glu-tRNA(Gln) amidotransferase subunit GatC [Hyphomicrobiales bacterium]
MAIDQATVRKVANLARIKVTDQQVANLEGELNQIIEFVEQLAEVNTDGVAPLTSAVAMTQPLRADVINDGGYADQIVKNAPVTDDGYFLVPRVVE